MSDKDELGDALNEMNQTGDFVDIELDDAAVASPVGTGSAIEKAPGTAC